MDMSMRFLLCFNYLYLLNYIIGATGNTDMPADVISELYLQYKNAASDGGNSFRRIYKKNKAYEIHVKKLKEVNGFKLHNLEIKEILRAKNAQPSQIIYINNPVESKIPHAFLTLDEFKNQLTNRVQRDLIVAPDKSQKTPISITEIKFTQKQVKLKVTKEKYKIMTNPSKTTLYSITREDLTAYNIANNSTTATAKDTKATLISDDNSTILTTNMTKEPISSQKIIVNTIILNTKTSYQLLNNRSIEKTSNISSTNVETTLSQVTNKTVHEVDPGKTQESTLSIGRPKSKTSSVLEVSAKLEKKEDTTYVASIYKATPKRNWRMKMTTRLKTTPTNRKRTTLGRPLVFMGSR